MSDDDRDSEQSSLDEVSKRFVPVRCVEDFQTLVMTEEESLCALVVTSFLCPFSAKVLPVVKEKIIISELPQTRRVRYFHVALLPEEKTDITALLQKDPVFLATNRPPTELQKKQLHKQAYDDLMELLTFLEICSTPCMLFFVQGKCVRISDVSDAPRVIATGSSVRKWEAVLQNAVVRRNELLQEYDAEKKREKRRIERERRREARRRAKAEEAEEDEEEED
ncbi:hypothetical protein TraAM80_02818 [Trypanosoma rangeli]|uniref:Thioredoxin domain-containing protein n=1 Tax=Trypanosoma rangeli TaxID=5698 RepID=A0A422NRY4_TRYRA|nr:uncharacterized protein TraAM80_02818 [Trypanosoma rangeli]RNF08245.1 hypothetical protein TraAM80_02818 [Trypanosoma rangeli]|eukprot:RNF08245.1 hypothetical protein TraAM80_02818 [Trypanosoma rangeli]